MSFCNIDMLLTYERQDNGVVLVHRVEVFVEDMRKWIV